MQPSVTSVSDIIHRNNVSGVRVLPSDPQSRKARTGVDMATVQTDVKYMEARRAFQELLSHEQTRGHMERGSNIEAVAVYIDTGRKFDKVQISTKRKGKTRPDELQVVFFIDREDGSIYGAKSPLAPNFKWFYGTVYDADKWDWTPVRTARPKNEEDAGVVVVGKYGEFFHYERQKAKKTA